MEVKFDVFGLDFKPDFIVFRNSYNTIGICMQFYFSNDYGLSVITDGYGREDGLFEIALLYRKSLHYDKNILSEVKGYLNIQEVNNYLNMVSRIKSEVN